ncbi:MAG: hypothetical protein AAF125_11345, partial [Chloroflexota bacterium]
MMTEKPKSVPERQFSFASVPIASVVWLLISTALVFLGTQTVTMEDQEKFDPDFAVGVQEADQPNTLILTLQSGTFRYNEVPEVIAPVETGTFTPDSDDLPPVAADIFDVLPTITEVTIEPQTITIAYDDDVEADAIRSRMNRPVSNAVANDRDTITGAVAEDADMTVVFTTTDDGFIYGQYTPQLVPTTETYDSREAAAAGSPLAQFLIGESNALQ